jgi:hypothetical protein
MLKCLSELGLERLSRGFVLHVLNEQSENGELDCGGILRSMDVWWANCLRDEGERGRVRALIGKVRAGDGYVYGHDVMALLGHRSRNT